MSKKRKLFNVVISFFIGGVFFFGLFFALGNDVTLSTIGYLFKYFIIFALVLISPFLAYHLLMIIIKKVISFLKQKRN